MQDTNLIHQNKITFKNLGDQPYDAKYLLFVYGPKVYDNFIALARELTSVTYQSVNDKQSYEHAHTLFLLLMVILLFSNNLQLNSIENKQSKLNKIQQNYIDIACRYLHDQFGLTIGRRMFKRLVPLLIGKIINSLQISFLVFFFFY